MSHSGVQDYYAVNAPAPGTVGVASARINHAYTGGSNTGVVGSRENPLAAGQDFSGVVIPGAVYTSSTGQVPAGGLGHNPNYTPPPPQPAHRSVKVIHISKFHFTSHSLSLMKCGNCILIIISNIILFLFLLLFSATRRPLAWQYP